MQSNLYYRYSFKIEYDGTRFDCGWQKQNSSKTSVQGTLTQAAKGLTNETVKFVAAGRTDRHVHALAQIVHADFTQQYQQKVLIEGMNWYLKESGCRVLGVKLCTDPKFHARFSAKSKIYDYLIAHSRVCSIFDKNRCWWITEMVKLDLDLLSESAQYLVGEYDFSSFRDSSCQAKTPVRKIDSIQVIKDSTQSKILLRFKARSFLHKQIRIMTGTLIDIARGRLSNMKHILELKNREMAGQTAPGHGLYLREVIFNKDFEG